MYIVSVSKNYIDELYAIKSVEGFSVKIEPLKPKNAITQCYRCQRIGHASLHCGMQARCVKCGEGHFTAECTLLKSTTSKCKCVNCGEDNPASYKGCAHYKEAMAARHSIPALTPSYRPDEPAL